MRKLACAFEAKPWFRRHGLGNRRVERAFTMVEILVVLALIAILMASIAPDLSRTYESMQLSAAAGRLGDMMAFCYSAASAQRAIYRLHIEPDMGTLWVMREVELETGERQYEPVQVPGMQTYQLPGNVQFDAEGMDQFLNVDPEDQSCYVQFRRDGTCDFATVRLLSLRGDGMQVSVNGLTGRVSIRAVTAEELEQEAAAEAVAE